MNKFIAYVILSLLCLSAAAQDYSWRAVKMDGSRTGTASPSKDNVKESLGVYKAGRYTAPNGTVHGRRSATARTARIVLDAQPAMASVKDVIG